MADKAKLLKIAQKHLSKGSLDKAIKTFRQLVEVDPRDQRLILRLADILARAGRKKEAIEHYEKVAEGYIKQDFTPKAIAVYRTILRLDPELLTAYEKLAKLYKKQGLEAEALSQFENLFQVYERKNDENKQIEVLKLMADMDPENLGFQVRLGEILTKKGRKKEAAEAFAMAASTLGRRGFHDRASQLFEKITALDPDNTVVRRELCAHHLESGQYEEARAEIEAILKVEPEDARMVLLLGRIHFMLGNKEEGEAKIAESIHLFLEKGELEPVMKEFLFVAQSHLKNGELDEAEAFFRQLANNVPGEAEVIGGLASVAEARKDTAGQIQNLLLLGRTRQQGGDQQGAVGAYRKVLEIDPLNEEANKYLENAPGPGMVQESVETPLPPLGETAEQDLDLEEIDEIEEISEVEEVQEVEELQEVGEFEGVEEVTFLETGEIEVESVGEEVPEDVIEIAIEEEVQETVLDEAGHVQIDEEVMEEKEPVPEITIEDADEETEFLIEVSEELDDGKAQQFETVETQPEADIGEEIEEVSVQELLAEADVYERYGLKDKVLETLEKARAIAPEDGAVKSRIAAFESGISGGSASAGGDLPGGVESIDEPLPMEETGLDPFAEELEEADFYRSQGLDEEAAKIYRSVLNQDPGNEKALKAIAGMEGGKGEPDTAFQPEGSGMSPEPDEPVKPSEPGLPIETPAEQHFEPAASKGVRSKLIVEGSAPEDMGGFLDIAEELRTELADEMEDSSGSGTDDEPVSFEEIFSQFKKGIEETLGEEEYETHYNLGIAYKDMGLYDDAIREFEFGARDPSFAQDSLSLMAMCHAEKKDYDEAAGAIERALEISSGGYRTGLYFQLAEVREKQKNWPEALRAYEEVRSGDSSFEGIDEAVQRVKALVEDASQGAAADDLSVENGVDDMLSDLIREVEEMAQESSDDTAGDPGKPKKDRISYL